MLDAPTLRRRLDEVLRTDSDLMAFCLDHYPDVHHRFGAQMDRVQKVNLLLQLVPDRDELSEKLAKYPTGLRTRENRSPGLPPSSGSLPSWRNPIGVLKAAIAAVPVMKYALGVAGLGAVVAIVTRGFGLDAGTATIGALIVLGLMAVLIVLAVAAQQSRRLVLPAMVLTWAVLTLLLSSSGLLLWSFFFSWPKPSHCLFSPERCETGASPEPKIPPVLSSGTPVEAMPDAATDSPRRWKVAGIVRNSRQAPLEGVLVSLPQLAADTRTDASGAFQLEVTTERRGLVLLRAEKAPPVAGGKPPYRPQEVHVYLGSTELEIVLEQSR